jgi:hypothetical protein
MGLVDEILFPTLRPSLKGPGFMIDVKVWSQPTCAKEIKQLLR